MASHSCFEEDNILNLHPVLCPILPAIHKKLLDNCTALLCLGFPCVQNRDDTEADLGPGVYLQGIRQIDTAEVLPGACVLFHSS